MKREAPQRLQAEPHRRALSSPAWAARWQGLMARLHLVGPGEDAQLLADLAAPPPAVRVLAFANAHAFNLAAHSPGFTADLAAADVLLRDGSGLAHLLRSCGHAPGLNMNGTDFIPRLLRACNGRPLAVLGTREPQLGRGVRRIARALMPGSTVLALDGFQPEARYLEFLARHQPAIVLLAMGMPRQEQLAQRLRRELNFPCLVICGGAIVDFLGGGVRRAPAPLRRLGLEWLWRLALEPRRLFKRYVIGNPLFLVRTAWLARQQA